MAMERESLKWLHVKAFKTFIFWAATIFALFYSMFDILILCVCLLISVCFRTAPVLQHCLVYQRASKILSKCNGCFFTSDEEIVYVNI